MYRSLWQYRNFVFTSIQNEFRSRFAQSKLGGLWMIVNPLSQVLIYALILSNVLAAKLPGIESQYAYSIYLMAGLLAWTLFNEVVSRCLNLFIEQGNLLKKMNFPKITLPAIVIGSSTVNNLLLLVAMMGIFIALGHRVNFFILLLIPLTALLVTFAAGLGLILGVINVFLRDIGQLVPIILQMLFWFTPIVYPVTIIPEQYRWLLSFNPIYAFTEAYQKILLYGEIPALSPLLGVGFASVFLLLLGLFMFRRANGEMVDVL